MPSYPVSSQKTFNTFFTRAFTAVGTALVSAALNVLRPVAPRTITTVSGAVVNDAVTTYLMNSSSAQTLTVPAVSTDIPIGTSITVVVLGTGQVTLAPENGSVTINTVAATLKSNGRYSVITLTKTSAAVFVANGDLAAS